MQIDEFPNILSDRNIVFMMGSRAMRSMIMPAMVLLQTALASQAATSFLRDPPIVGDVPKPNTYLDSDKWTARAGTVSIPSTVPGDLITDLQRAGMIGDPMHGVNWRDRVGCGQKKAVGASQGFLTTGQ